MKNLWVKLRLAIHILSGHSVCYRVDFIGDVRLMKGIKNVKFVECSFRPND